MGFLPNNQKVLAPFTSSDPLVQGVYDGFKRIYEWYKSEGKEEIRGMTFLIEMVRQRLEEEGFTVLVEPRTRGTMMNIADRYRVKWSNRKDKIEKLLC